METLSLNRYGLQETQFTRLDHVDETEWVPLDQLDAEKHLGKRVMIRARLHHVRGTAKNAFLVMRAGKQLIQAVLFVNEAAGVTKDMVKFASALSKESILDLGGELVSSVVKSEIITFKTVEIRADFIKVLSASSDRLPFQIEDASRVDPLDFNDLGEDVEVSTTTGKYKSVITQL